MSQLSDVYPSSSFDTQDGLPFDALQYLIPNDSLSHRQSQSQLPSESQFDLALDLPDNRVQIRTASQAPDTLPRIRPNRINELLSAHQRCLQNSLSGGFTLTTAERRPAPTFTQRIWEQKILNLITTSQLPFRFLEHQEFHDLLSYARLAPTPPSVPSRKTLQRLPSGAKLSLALDCWTSPFQDAFMAIIGYFIDQEWEYREVLIGFEPLSGTHSGVNLGEVVLQILQKHQITDRVLAVTTDNASNNKTLIAAASPKNDTTESVWSDDRVRLLRARQQKHEIADTLNKVRGLAVYINGSPQRKEAFLNLQSNGQKLVPIQDVRTRWNSTFLMLRRAKRLHITFDEYCSHHDQPHFALSTEGRRQIDYLLYILQPFFTFTTLAAKDKLSKYYGMTDDVEGDIYVIGTILDPSNKMEFFSTSDWAPNNTGKDYKKEYRESLQSLFWRYSLRIPSDITQSDSRLSTTKSALERACRRDLSKPSTGLQHDELTRYLQSDTIDESARIFWRNHEKEFPILVSITRDIMSIPVTGAGVERLFNSARDVCHYRRGSLNPETVRDIMFYLCTTRFDIKEEQRLILQEYLSEQEIAARSKELDIETHYSEAISDTEEDIKMYLDTPATLPLSEVAARKRLAVTFDDEEDSNADEFADPENSASPLPDTQHRFNSLSLENPVF
ncbi:hypothetical protein N7486_007628 [Penicillium sp. IBT 16267x]|nr:hypothetical protein N7486_007628 [Penicillium sp. IBT 16267x]